MVVSAAFLTPAAAPSVRGNAITVERIARGLRNRGVGVRVWDMSALDEGGIAAGIEADRPAIVHAFHALRSGPLALRVARRLEVPLLVTLTGTDANHDLFDPGLAATVRRVLEGAAAIVAFHSSIAQRVSGALPDLAPKIVIVPQGATLDDEPYDLAARWRLPEGRVLFLVPAGIRPVKRPRFPLTALARVIEQRPLMRLAYAGPVIDPREGQALARALEGKPWARHLGAVPHAQMASLLRQADVVVNASESEGGMANAVIEAMLCGRTVLASNIEGNRSLVDDGVTGLLFRNEAEFAGAAVRLVDDRDLRARLGHAGHERVLVECESSRELDSYLAIYRRLVPAAARS